VGEDHSFAEVNAYVYHSARGVFYDGVIWCLGPVVDDSHEYSWTRMWIASITYSICRRVIRAQD
jgi:hypothetical protein